MKKGKNLLAVFLVLVMTLAMSFTAFATEAGTTDGSDTENGNVTESNETGSITIKNPTAGISYAVYKVFDLSYAYDANQTMKSVAYTYTTSGTVDEEGKVSGDDLYAALIEEVTVSARDEEGNEVSTTYTSPFALSATVSSGVYNVTLKEGKTTTEIIQFLDALVKKDILKKTGNEQTAQHKTNEEENELPDVEEVKFENLDLGYYYVTSTLGAVVSLDSVTGDVTIVDKNEIPFDKTVDDHSVEVGQEVTFTITGEVPDYTGFETYLYKITDNMSDGLTFNKDVEVKVNGEKIYPLDQSDEEQSSGVTVLYKDEENALCGITDAQHVHTRECYGILICQITEDGHEHSVDNDCYDMTSDFILTIDVKEEAMKIGASIEVTYSATVNEAAVSKISKNEAVLTYSNDPKDSSSTETIEDKEELYSAKIVIDKYEDGHTKTDEDGNEITDTGKKLAGAKFILYRYGIEINGDVSYTSYDENTENAVMYYYKYDQENDVVGWDKQKANATVVTTDDEGAASFIGLEDGTYYLLETEAPDGYNLLGNPVEITIDGKNANEDSSEEGNAGENSNKLEVIAEVANAAGSELPSTGGVGTTLFYIIGGILVIGAGILLIVKRRMDAEK